MKIGSLGVVVLALSVFCQSALQAAEIRIDGDRVILKTDDGEVLDTANLPQSETNNTDPDLEVKKNNISIGTVTNEGGEQKNIVRRTTMENVTIISNGDKTVYRKENSTSGGNK